MTMVTHSHEIDIMFQFENYGSIASFGILYKLKLLIRLALIKAMQNKPLRFGVDLRHSPSGIPSHFVLNV